jgi:nucleoside-diphosphate-sugar epimerase
MSQSDDVVILGGGGFIGSHLTAQLKGRVRSLRVVGRSLPADAGRSGVEYVRADVTNADALENAIKGASVVYQLTIESDFARGARNVANACLSHGVRRLIFASTSDALYLGKSGASISEREGADGKPELRNAYSRGKIESENLFLKWHSEKRLPVVIMRPCLVVGSGGRLAHGGVGVWSDEICLLGWGNGDNPMPFVLVKDVAAALVAALDAPNIEGMSFNLAGDVFLSAREYVKLVAERTGRNFRFYPRNLAWMYAIDQTKALIQRAIGMPKTERQSYRDMKSSAMLTRIDNTITKKALGWTPNSSLDVFIKEAIDTHLTAAT